MNDSTNRSFTPRRRWLTLGVGPDKSWALLLLSVMAIIALAATGDAGRAALRYQRDALIQEHQYWRLLTGHLVHGSWQHTWLNLAGVAVIVGLFRGTYSARQWCWIALVSTACIDLGLLLLMPQLQWYVGLSGLLHGLLAAGTVAWWRVEDRRLAAVLSVILAGKLIWEQRHGALPLSGDLNVIVNAHLYGAVGGLAAGLMLVKRMPRPAC